MARRALRSFSEGGLKATESSDIHFKMPRAGARGAVLFCSTAPQVFWPRFSVGLHDLTPVAARDAWQPTQDVSHAAILDDVSVCGDHFALAGKRVDFLGLKGGINDRVPKFINLGSHCFSVPQAA